MEENENSPDSNEIKASKISEAEIEPREVEDPEIELKRRLNDKDLKRKGQNYFSENPSGSKLKSQKVCHNDNGIDKKFKNLEENLVTKLESLELKMQKGTDQLAQAKNTGNTINNENDVTEKENHERLISLAASSKNIEILENALKPLKIYRVEVSPIECFYYCSICFAGNVPSHKSKSTAGCFAFNKVDYDLKKEEIPDKQPKHVVTHSHPPAK